MPPKKKPAKRRTGRDGRGKYKKDCYVYNGKTKKFSLKKKGKKRSSKGKTSVPVEFFEKKKTKKKTRGGNIFQGGGQKKTTKKKTTKKKTATKKKSTTKKKTTTYKKKKKGGNMFQQDKRRPSKKPAFVSPALQQAYYTGTPVLATPVGNSTPPTNINIFQNDKTPPVTFAHLDVLAHIIGKK